MENVLYINIDKSMKNHFYDFKSSQLRSNKKSKNSTKDSNESQKIRMNILFRANTIRSNLINYFASSATKMYSEKSANERVSLDTV